MSLTSLIKRANPNKIFGYAIAAGGTALAVLDAFRLATGDAIASASLAENFLSHAGAIAGGIGFAQASPASTPAPASATPTRPVLIMPRRDFVMA